MGENRVLVVGTTADYIETIHTRFPGTTVFITAPKERARWQGTHPDAKSEVVCSLRDHETVLRMTKEHIDRYGITLVGVTCFDCESLMLASSLAHVLGLQFPSKESVARSRSKYSSHSAWHAAGIPCPETKLVRSREEVVRAFVGMGGPVVLKPLTGSGSELVFICRNQEECETSFGIMKRRLVKPANRRMYDVGDTLDMLDPKKVFLMESYIEGTEYSCDFMIDGEELTIIRTALKVHAPLRSMVTTLAYILPAPLSAHMDMDVLRSLLKKACRALGLDRTLAMVDLIVREDRIYLLELTPRPGGDCLPQLILASSGFDMLGAALDFARGKPIRVPPASRWRHLVGMRLFASREGLIERIDPSFIEQDDRVIECGLKRDPGHIVVMPPEDYESLILGHVIFKPSTMNGMLSECRSIADKLVLEIEEKHG